MIKNVHVFNSDLTDAKKKRINKGKKLYLIGLTSLTMALATLAGCSNKTENSEIVKQLESPVISNDIDKEAESVIATSDNLLNFYDGAEMDNELQALIDAVKNKKVELTLLLKGYDKNGQVTGVDKVDRIEQCIQELEIANNNLIDYIMKQVKNSEVIPVATIEPTTTNKPDGRENDKPTNQATQTPSSTQAPQATQTPSATQTPQPTQTPAPQATTTPAWTPGPVQVIPTWTPGPSTTTPQPTQTPSATQTPQPTQTPAPTGTQSITDEELQQFIQDHSGSADPYGETTGGVDPSSIYQGSDGDYYVNTTTPQATQTPAPIEIPTDTYNANGYIWASYQEYINWIDNGCGEFYMDENGICYNKGNVYSKHR